MASGPRVALTPLELLENDGTRSTPLLAKIYSPLICGSVAFIAVIAGNWVSRRPYFSGIQKHILAAAIGVGVGKVADDYKLQYLADRDAVYRHYVELHPEDFPPYERKKYADVFEPWFPVR